MTNHANLQYWKSLKNLNRCMAWWQADLQEYDYEIWHISGKENIPSDMLSRPPGVDQGKNDNQQQIVILSIKFKAATIVMPSGEAGQWGPRPSHCGHWHWTVTADLSPVQFKVVLGRSHEQLDWLSYVPIQGLPLELRCPVAMTLIPLLVISGDFCLWYGLRLVPVVVLYGLGLPSGFLFCYYTVWDCFLLSVLSTILVSDCFPFRVLYWFWTGSVSSQKCPATVFKKLQSRREALSFTKSILVLLQNW